MEGDLLNELALDAISKHGINEIFSVIPFLDSKIVKNAVIK